eukprot:INCI18196.5.p1 GENE.INCI18196.5~~INCI18196.5.p1  ORF type:complete len:367 (-),score=71.90 INCI18196.5:1233-2333(-)
MPATNAASPIHTSVKVSAVDDVLGAQPPSAASSHTGEPDAKGDVDSRVLTVRRRGITEPADQALLNRLTDRVQQELTKSRNSEESVIPHAGPSHVMLWGRGSPTPSAIGIFDSGDLPAVLDLSRRLVASLTSDATFHLLSVRLLIAPPGCGPQAWHLDYRSYPGLRTQTAFAAMTPSSALNCTELAEFQDADVEAEFDVKVDEAVQQSKILRDRLVATATARAAAAAEAAKEAGAADDDKTLRVDPSRHMSSNADATVLAMQKEMKACLTVPIQARQVAIKPVVCDTFDTVRLMTSAVPHRRSPCSLASSTRITLNVDFTTVSEEKLRETKYTDDDSMAAYKDGGIAAANIIDVLDSEVIVQIEGL